MAKKYNKMTPQEQWNAKMSAVNAYEKETNDISPLEQAKNYKKKNGHYPWEHMVITKDSKGNLVEKNINKVNYNADTDPSQPIVVPEEQKDKNQSWFAKLFGTNKPKNNGPSLPPGPYYVPYQERTQENTQSQPAYPVAPNVQPQANNEGNKLGKLLNNFISAIKSIGNDISNTSPKDWRNTVYNSFAAGAGDVNKAAVNIPRLAWEGYTKLLDKALPDNMYDPDKDVTLQGLNKLYSFYDNTNKQIESKIKNDNLTQQMIGGAVRSMPLMITSMAGGAPLASKAAASGASGSLVKAAELAPFGALAGSNYAGEAKEEGAAYGQQVAYGLAGGLAESITEMPFMSSWIDRIGGKKAILNGTENFLQKFGKVGLDYLKDVGSEAWQEAIVDPMTATAKKMIYKPDMPVEGKGGIIDPTQMGEDAIGGSVMAIMMAALHLPANYASRRIAERYVQDRHVPTVNEANLLADQVESDSAQEKTENVNRIVDNFRQAAGVAPKAQGINNQFVNSSENIPKNIPKSNVELPSTQPIQPQVGSIQVTQNLKNGEQPIANNNRSKLFKTVDNIYNINPKLINVDPERFQFKADTDTRTGASKLLKGVNVWNKDLAGTALVWIDKEGKPWIVDGHHRRELAIRTDQSEMPVQILRESDGITDKQARVIGAQRNLANGRGTATDAAKLFRDGSFTLNDLEKSGLSKTEPVVKKGLAIAQLNDRLFHEVVNKHLSENQGSIIGGMLPKDGGINDAKQSAIYDEISDKSVSDGVLKEMIDLIKNTNAKGVEQQTLFGTVTSWGIDFKTIPQLIAGIKSKMVNDKNTFGRVIKSESSLKDKGNILNTTENKKTKGILENALKALDLGKGKAGDPINSVITKYAEMMKAGMPLSEASNQAEKEIVSIMQSGEYINKMLAQNSELADKPIDGQINIFGGANNAVDKRRGSETGSTYNRGRQEKGIRTEKEETKSNPKVKAQVKESKLQKGKLPGPQNEGIKLQDKAVANQKQSKEYKTGEVKSDLDKWFDAVMPGDIDYKRAYNAYRGTSFEPDRRASEDQQSYVSGMKNVYRELKPLAETEEQKKVLLNELNIYKSKYIEHFNAVLDAKARTLSPMITGPARFPTSRNQKALNAEEKRVTEFLYWNKKAVSSIKKKIKSAMTAEQVSNSEYNRLKSEAIDTIITLSKIESGKMEGGDASSFKTSLAGMLKRSVDNGHVNEVKKVLKYIQDNEGKYLKRPVFTKRNSIWTYVDSAKNISKEKKPNEVKNYEKYDGVNIVNNNDLGRTQIIFDGKPSAEVIQALKKEGWHWSPKNNAWQRKLTSNAEYSANSIIKKFYGNTTGSNDIEIIGNVGFLPPGYSSYRLKRPSNNRSSYTFENAEVEKNWNASHGIKGKPIKSKLNEFFENMKNDFTRTFSTLPEEKEFAKLKFEIVRYPKIRGIAIQSTIRTLDDILSGLNKDMYNTFERKVLLDDLEEEYLLEHDLPNDFTPEIVDDELERIKPYITPEVQEALDKRKQHWDEIKNQYVQAMSDVGFDVSQRFTKESYFRHQVIEYQNLHGGIYGTGKRLRVATQRGFLKQRQGYIGSINTDYLQAEMEVMAQMKADTEIAKMIRRIEKKYSITDALKKEATEIKKRGHTSNVKWKDLIPEGYTTWQPREGRIYYLAYSIPEKIVDSLVDGIGEDLSLDPNDIKKVLAVGQKRKQYVVKQEVADTLNHLFTEKEDVWVSKLSKKILGAWKSWVTGINPKQMAKFNIRNASGDLDAVVGEVPGVLKYVHRATEEIIQARKGFYTKNFGEWVDLGGFEDSLLNSEGIRGVNKLGKFAKLTGYRELNPLKRYKGFAINLSNNREAVLRYAAYLYYKNSIRKNNGKILNYGYSNPKLVNGLDTVEEKAFKLSKDLLGSYDETSVFGRYVSDHLIPFYRWNEVNLTRYIRAIRNAVTDNGNVENIGKAVASKYGIKIIGGVAKRLGKLFIKMFLMTTIISIWNNLLFQNEEDQLSDQVKDKPHLILGRDKDGKISYFSRLGALNDFLEWFGADRLAGDIRDIMNGNKTLKEQVEQMAYAPASKAVNSLNPATKLPFELLLNGKLYPNIQKPQAIRDKGAYIAQSLGLDQEYRNIAGLPHKPYLSTLSDTFLYKSDPEESAYYKIVDLKNKFEVKNGKLPYASYTTSPKSNALYYLKTALKYGDKAAVKKYMQKYIELGGTEKGYKTSMKSLDPLYGLNTKEKTEFMRTLTPQEKETFKRAKKFYDETLDNKVSFQNIKNSIKN